MKRAVAIANQKGGVGKTTTAINLAASLSRLRRSVLLVDMDPQANLTSGVGQKGCKAPGGTVYDLLIADEPPRLDDFIIPTGVDRLSLAPADRDLTGAEIELVDLPDRESRLRPFIRAARRQFDYVLIDTPPSLGLLTLNALVAADEVLMPLTCEYLALEGMTELDRTVRRVQKYRQKHRLKPVLEIGGVLLTMADSRTALGRQVAAFVRRVHDDKVFDTVIPRNVRLGEAPSHGKPVIAYDRSSRGATAYLALAREVLDRRRRRKRHKEQD